MEHEQPFIRTLGVSPGELGLGVSWMVTASLAPKAIEDYIAGLPVRLQGVAINELRDRLDTLQSGSEREPEEQIYSD